MNNLRALRRVKGITQEELGNKIGLGQREISKIELEKLEPTAEEVKKISSYFKVNSGLIFPDLESNYKPIKKKAKCEVENIASLEDGIGNTHWYITLKLSKISHFLADFELFTNNSFIRLFSIELNIIELNDAKTLENSFLEIDISTSFHRYKNIMADFIRQNLECRTKCDKERDYIFSLFDSVLRGDPVEQ